MKKLFAITTALTLFLVACNSDNSSEQKRIKTKQKLNPKRKNHPTKRIQKTIHRQILKLKTKENLPDKTKLALIFVLMIKANIHLLKQHLNRAYKMTKTIPV